MYLFIWERKYQSTTLTQAFEYKALSIAPFPGSKIVFICWFSDNILYL